MLYECRGDGLDSCTTVVQVGCDEYLRVGASSDGCAAVGEKVHDGVSNIGIGQRVIAHISAAGVPL